MTNLKNVKDPKLLEMLKGIQELLGWQRQLVNAAVRKLEPSPKARGSLNARRLRNKK